MIKPDDFKTLNQKERKFQNEPLHFSDYNFDDLAQNDTTGGPANDTSSFMKDDHKVTSEQVDPKNMGYDPEAIYVGSSQIEFFDSKNGYVSNP
jgi:hypothetical protein